MDASRRSRMALSLDDGTAPFMEAVLTGHAALPAIVGDPKNPRKCAPAVSNGLDAHPLICRAMLRAAAGMEAVEAGPSLTPECDEIRANRSCIRGAAYIALPLARP